MQLVTGVWEVTMSIAGYYIAKMSSCGRPGGKRHRITEEPSEGTGYRSQSGDSHVSSQLGGCGDRGWQWVSSDEVRQRNVESLRPPVLSLVMSLWAISVMISS